MNYQRSPLPYLLILIAILGISIYTGVTIDRRMEEPIVYSIQNSESDKPSLTINEDTGKPRIILSSDYPGK